MNVEVIENHQPINALKDVIRSEQVAINLKLRGEKMDRPIGNITLGGGYSDELLWTFDAFVLYADKKKQTIVMYKTNNTGNNIALEMEEHTDVPSNLEPAYKSKIPDLFSLRFENVPIGASRYLFNKTHIVSVNDLEFGLSYQNIFNKKHYSYSIYNGLDTYRYSYRIRPSGILVNATFRF